MSFKLLEAVYNLDKNATTPTEQAVLVALAYRANDKTRLCYPKQETIAAMTHLHRATVAACLNSLRERGLIEWKSGGLTKKRGKYGQPLANDYTLKIPTKKVKSADSAWGEPVANPITVSSTATPQCRPRRHCNVVQGDTAMSSTATPTEIPTQTTNKISNRKDCSPESSLNFAMEKLFADIGIERRGGADKEVLDEYSPVKRALQVCGIAQGSREYMANNRSFTSVMIKIGRSRAMDEVLAFESEMRQGEHEAVENPAAVLMTRLKRMI